MKNTQMSCLLTQQQLIDEYFLEYRAKVLDLAAYLDRLNRAKERDAAEEFRYLALLDAIEILNSDFGFIYSSS